MSTIYLVDDHAILRDGLRALLERAGHLVVGEAATAADARAQVPLLQPDVVLLDLELGEDSGLELLAWLQRLGARTRVIVLTLSGQAATVAEAVRLGAAGYLLKGAASVELMAALEDIAGGRRHFSAKVADALAHGTAGTPASSGGGKALSPRERQILVMVARGKSSAAIGQELGLSPKTVDTYRSRLMTKLRLSDVPAIVRWAIREGLVGLHD